MVAAMPTEKVQVAVKAANDDVAVEAVAAVVAEAQKAEAPPLRPER